MMELKKFEAPTLAEALQVIKRELGPEAIIVSTKNNKGGFGLMSRASVEVTAAVSKEALDKKRFAESRISQDSRDNLARKPAQKMVQAYDILSGKRLSQDYLAKAPMPKPTQTLTKPAAPLTQRRYIDIRDDDGPAESLTTATADRMAIRTATPSRPLQRPAEGLLSRTLARLLEAGVDADLTRELGDELKVIMVRDQINKEELVVHNLARILMSKIRVARPLSERLRIPTTPRVITFVGPTGVGKTTTLAKIAAELVINQQKQVVLATTDTYKIAAVEQLQTYANILKIPLEVCASTDALESLAASLGPDALVLVDTAGFGPRDHNKLVELSSLLSGVRMEIHLCLAAMTRDRELVASFQRFKVLEPQYLVMTKFDETSSFGGVVNIAVKTQLPLSYFTMGQRVPEDMEVATKERLADLVLQISEGGI